MDWHNSNELTSIWWKLFNKASVNLSPHRFQGVIWNDSDKTRNEGFSKFCKHREFRLMLVLRSFDILKITRNSIRFNSQFSWLRPLQYQWLYRGRYWYRLYTLTVSVLVSILTVSLPLQCRYQLLVQSAKHVSGYTLQFAQAVVVLKIDKTVNWWLHSNTDRHWPRTHTGLVSHWDAFRGVVFHLLPTSPLKASAWETVLTLTWPFSLYFSHVKPFLL